MCRLKAGHRSWGTSGAWERNSRGERIVCVDMIDSTVEGVDVPFNMTVTENGCEGIEGRGVFRGV